MTINKLIKQCIKRDHSAWNEFIKLYGRYINKAVAYKLYKMRATLSRDEVNDIVQEIFLDLWEKNKLSKIQHTEKLKGWLVVLSIHMTIDYCKKRFRAADKTSSLNEDLLTDNRLSVEKLLELGEFDEILSKEINKLDSKYQKVLKLRLYEGKTYKDISSVMNIPENSASTQISRAKKKLCRVFKNQYGIQAGFCS